LALSSLWSPAKAELKAELIDDFLVFMSRLNLHQLEENLSAHLKRDRLKNQTCELYFLSHGEANAIFRLNQQQLVRVAINTPNQRLNGEASQLTGFEAAVLSYLKGTGIGHTLKAAQLSPTSDFPYTYLITDYLEGESLNYSRTHLAQCATTLAQLHRFPLADHEISQLMPQLPVVDRPMALFYQESKDYAQPYLESDEAEAEIVEMIHAVLAKARSHLPAEQLLLEHPYRCLVHSDHSYDNWVINSQQAHLIDWEWAEISSPAGDLGHFLSPVTICRRQGYQLPAEDRAFFLRCYYEALADDALATTIKRHFAAFGPFPALRSLCWTAGYWVTARRWYANAPSSEERIQRSQESRDQFPQLWQAVMTWLDEALDEALNEADDIV
jgi:thiamine kinase-like enzyme